MKKITFLFLFMMVTVLGSAQSVFINEIHYDNIGGDTDEAVEIAGPAGTDLTGWSLVPYNGSNGQEYSVTPLTATIDDEGATGYGAISVPISGLQNGNPDGIALVDDLGAVIQFLSYEGAFAATNGPANGMVSTDIGVEEDNGTTVAGTSLQLTGTGNDYSDFTWNAPAADSFGDINVGQTFLAPPPPPVGLFTECATDNPQQIQDFMTVTSEVDITASGTIGAMTDEYVFDQVLADLQHNKAGDLIFTLTSPEGTVFDLSSNNGGNDGLDAPGQDFILRDDSANGNVTTWTGAPTAADYIAEDGDLNTAFDGEDINGIWTLTISDGGLGGQGNLRDFCLSFIANGVVGTPPVITCPGTPGPGGNVVTATNDEGVCNAIVNYALPSVLDVEDNPDPTPMLVSGPASGGMFDVGDTVVTYEVTDSDGNTEQCSFTVTVVDNEAPVAMCVGSITVELDAVTGMASITPDMIDDGSTDNCGIATYTLDNDTFDCSMIGDNTVTLTVTDDEGNEDTCTATVVVEDNTAPEIVCIGEQLVPPVTDSTSPNVAIPDGDPVGITSTLTVTNDVSIDDLNVEMDVTHTWVADLKITLESPAGTVVTLYEVATGCSANDLTFTFDDEGTGSLADCTTGSANDAYPEDSYVPDNALSAFDGESTVGDWILTISDNTGVDTGTLNTWGITYEFAPMVTPPYPVDLGADGTATFPAMNLIDGATDNCNFTVTIGGLDSTPQSLTTTFNQNPTAFADVGGYMFDVMAVNDITVNTFDINLLTGSGSTDVEVYYKTGSHVGSETTPADWTLIGTATGITSNGDLTATPLNLNLGQFIPAGNTAAFYITTTDGDEVVFSDNGNNVGDLQASDSNLEIYEGVANFYPFASPSPFALAFNGTVDYFEGTPPNTDVTLDCSNLGENQIEVTVTDDSGNAATCMATVVVSDVTAPVIVCQDTDIVLGEDGTATIDPYDLFAQNPSTFQAMVIGSDNASGAAGTTDFTVDVTADVTVSFDWNFTTDDTAAGFDGFGYLVNGTYTQLTSDTTLDQSGTASVTLTAGDEFGFRSDTFDNLFGGTSTTVTNFTPGFNGQFAPDNWTLDLTNSDGDAFFVEIPGGPMAFDACGIETILTDVTEVSCDDIGTPISVVILVSDASGNTATCTTIINVVDTMAPVLTCPGDQMVDSDDNTGTYTLPDYFDTGDATATDNCTADVTTTQDPAPGTELGVGDTNTITLTAEDAEGNISTCTFNVDVDFLGVQDNALENAISMYPNPASSQVTIANRSNIALEQAMIYDINGKLVNQINLSTMQGEKVIDVSALSTGVYMVRIIGEQASVVKRLIKK